jgi:hypothetical protein
MVCLPTSVPAGMDVSSDGGFWFAPDSFFKALVGAIERD